MATKILEKTCDIVVVGAGHAGCEAHIQHDRQDVRLHLQEQDWVWIQLCLLSV